MENDYSAILDTAAKNEQSRLRSEAEALAAMTKTAGWRILSRFFSEKLSAIRDSLMTTTDMDEIRRLQETAKAYAFMVRYPDLRIAEALALNQSGPQMGQPTELGDE